MNQYQYRAMTWVGIIQTAYILGIILLAGYFKNWWLLFLILTASTKETENRIMGIRNE